MEALGNRRGWFAIPGVQAGDRTVEEQMLGLAHALEVARGKSVLDLGCAEGAIAAHFAASGAAQVHGLDNNREFLKAAQAVPGVRFGYADLNSDWPAWLEQRYDVVLALAILHKLRSPADGIKRACKRARYMVVMRAPANYDGTLGSKHYKHSDCFVAVEMARWGFRFLRREEGPRREPVLYWVR